jgi:cysteine-rich repeat protein
VVQKFFIEKGKTLERVRTLKITLTILFFTFINFALVSVSRSEYLTIQLTNNSYDDILPQISDDGYMVWFGFDGSDYEIFLDNRTGITQITNNTYNDMQPQINNNGYVAWHSWDGSDTEIYLYDGAGITQVTNNSYNDILPQINNNGYVTWQGWDGTDWEIYLYDGAGITQVTNNSYDDGAPQISDNGYVIWYGFDGLDFEIFVASPRCGDSIVGLGEECDDGNNISGDGCSATCKFELYWQDYNGGAYGGYMLDIDQKQDFDNADNDNNPLTGVEQHYCVPVSEANSLWWLDKAYHLGIFLNPSEGTGYCGGDTNHDGESNILDLVRDMAILMGTNVNQPGTLLEGEALGIDHILAKCQMNNWLYGRIESSPQISFIEEAVKRSRNVILNLGFWQVENIELVGQEQWKITWGRIGGHAVAVAGADSANFLLAISDPYFDAAEDGNPGVSRPASGHLPHPYNACVHNNEGFASHDVYSVVPSISPGGNWSLLNYPAIRQDFPPDFESNNGGYRQEITYLTGAEPLVSEGMTLAEIEAAVIVSSYTWYEESDPALTYLNTWKTYYHRYCSGGALTYSCQTGAKVSFSFIGTGIRWIVAKAPMLGKAKACLDGNVFCKIVDLYSPGFRYQDILQKTGFSPGPHTLTIEVLGQKNPRSANYCIDIDAFEAVP